MPSDIFGEEPQMSAKRERAKEILVHHLRWIAGKAGAQWDTDSTTEIECAVDFIIDSAINAVREEIRQRIKDAREGRG